MAYSTDLRERVISAIDNGTAVIATAKTFRVCIRVIYNWLKLRKETNSLKPKTGYQKGHSHKIKDWDRFKIFVETNKFCTIPAMAKKWEQCTGDSISESVIQRGLKKINYTSKKNF